MLLTAKGAAPVGNFLRSVLLKAPTFEDALPLLENTPLASPMYLIVGGLREGRVITRDRDGLSKESQDTSLFGKEHHELVPKVRTLPKLPHTHPVPHFYTTTIRMDNPPPPLCRR